MGCKPIDKDLKQLLPQVNPSLGMGPATRGFQERFVHSFTFRNSVPSTRLVPGAVPGAGDMTVSKADGVSLPELTAPGVGEMLVKIIS